MFTLLHLHGTPFGTACGEAAMHVHSAASACCPACCRHMAHLQSLNSGLHLCGTQRVTWRVCNLHPPFAKHGRGNDDAAYILPSSSLPDKQADIFLRLHMSDHATAAEHQQSCHFPSLQPGPETAGDMSPWAGAVTRLCHQPQASKAFRSAPMM